MNYARLSEWLLGQVEDLVSFGVPRGEAFELVEAMKHGAIAAEAQARCDRQFLLDFKREGPTEMARRSGKTRQAMWKRRRLILGKPNSLPMVDA